MKNTMNTVSDLSKKLSKRALSFALILALLLSVMLPGHATAAGKSTTVTRSYKPMSAESLFRCLDMYGMDTFQITYDRSSKKILSVRASQKAKALGTDMVERGGIRLVNKTNKVWTYQTTWYLNFTLLPKPVQQLAKLAGCKYACLTSLGRICTVKVNYQVSADSLRHSMSSKFQVPSKLQSTAKKICRCFTQAF